MRKIAQTVGAAILGTLLLGLLGERITSYYRERDDAVTMKEQFATDVIDLVGKETEQLTVLATNIAPESYLDYRCSDVATFPAVLAGSRAKVCADASLAALLDEQQRDLVVRSTHLEARSLQTQLAANLSSTDAAETYARLNRGLEALRRLNSSSSCGAERVREADTLRRSYPWVTDTLVSDLVGPDGRREPCDFHGRGFPAAASFVAQGLSFESTVVSSRIRDSTVSRLVDTQSDLFFSLVRDPVVLILLVAGVAPFVLPLVAALRRRAPAVARRPAAKSRAPS